MSHDEDGHYFCTMCNTQSQEMRVVAADDENITASTKKIYTKKSRGEEVKEKQRNHDMGRPWSMYEAYTIILQHQVEAFIKLGAQQRLKDVVFKIWANYLHKLDLAFTDHSTPCEPLQRYDRQREKFKGTTDKPRVKNVLGRRRRKRTMGAAKKDADKQSERDIMNEALEGEEFDEDENPLEKTAATSDEDWSTGEDSDTDRYWQTGRPVLAHKSVYKIKMITTISVCYLGLMYTNPLVTVADVIRWIRSEAVPYTKAVFLIPEEMHFCNADWRLFGMGEVPFQGTFRVEVGRIAFFLGLDDFPEFPFKLLVHKYVMQLDLPAEVHGYAMNVYVMFQQSFEFRPSFKFKYLPVWEGLAMATVIVILKLIFNLNDHSERVMSEATRELKDLCSTGEPLFNWDDWVRHLKERLQTEENEKSEAAMLKSNIDAIKYTCKTPRYKEYNALFRKFLQGPLVEMSERWKQRKSNDGYLDDRFSDILENWGVDGNDETRQNEHLIKKIEQAGKLFRNSTVEHIVHPSMFSLHGTMDSRSNEPQEDENADNQNGSHGNAKAYSTFTNISDRKHFKATMGKIDDARHESVQFEGSAYSESVCYTWLVSTCATMIGLEKDELQDEIAKLEAIVLGDPGGDPRLTQFLINLKKSDKTLFQKWNIKKGK
ncbi:hypothetical protein DPMN_165706 [Dreissena polymorpha]|uniref:TATA box-binding protein-associated factor RNA polymerase I subunit B n=1 Tax=Dreissena polymorpha TaxID=45954 RepID=A0A9D4IUU9_DREPO|nr:hypothetical protein DPMN_165706 [Dreissena polymorpha]